MKNGKRIHKAAKELARVTGGNARNIEAIIRADAPATKPKLVIKKVTIRHDIDMDPDTSWLGEYSNRPSSEFSMDRATETLQGDIDAGLNWLDRIAERVEQEQVTCEEHVQVFDANCSVCEQEKPSQKALDTIRELKENEPFDDVSWNSRTYRYFNPGTVESFKIDAEWIPANLKTKEEREAYWEKSMRESALADYKRMESLNNGDYYFMGVSATAEVWNPITQVVQRIHSGGLWGIESDSGREHIESVEKEQLAELKTELTALGFSTRAISKAFQNIERKEN